MIKKKYNSIYLWHFEKLLQYKDVFHFVTERNNGFSDKKWAYFNQSFTTGDKKTNVLKNRSLLARSINIKKEQFFFPDQSHSNNYTYITENSLVHDLSNTDALFTNIPGKCLCICTADCVPIILYEPGQKSIAVIHAGWRGIVNQIIEKTTKKFIKQFKLSSKNIIACIGPSISSEHYNVEFDVVKPFENIFNKDLEIVKYMEKGIVRIDLKNASRKQLIDSEISDKNIEISEFCTYNNNELFYSARKEGILSGRFVSGIFIKPIVTL